MNQLLTTPVLSGIPSNLFPKIITQGPLYNCLRKDDAITREKKEVMTN